MSKVYPSNLTAPQFEFLAPRFLSDSSGRGRPCTTSRWDILNATFTCCAKGALGGADRVTFRPGKRFTLIFAVGKWMAPS